MVTKKIIISLVCILINSINLLFINEIYLEISLLSSILIGIISNLMVIFFTIFFLDNFVKEQKNKKIKDINKTKSELIAFGIERMQYHILVFLGLIQKLEAKDANLYNGFKIFSYTNEKFDEKINNGEILEVFKNQLLTVRDPKKVFDGFKEIIKTEVNEVGSGLEDIYPIPKTIFLKIVKEDSHSLIGKYSVADFLDEFKTKCKKDKVSLKGFDTKLLLKIGISMGDDDFKIFFLNLIGMRKSAYNSDLYDII